MNPDQLGKEDPVPSVPLEPVLSIRPTGIPVVDRVRLDPESSPLVGLTVPHLEEPDGYIPLFQFDEPSPDIITRRERDQGRVTVL